jgi:hypothetical protein
MAVNNPGNPLTHFGRQVRKQRQAHGWSVHEMARRTGLAAPYWSQIENGRRPPTQRVAEACDEVFPERNGWFLEYYTESRDWTPPGLRTWAEYEDKAARLSVWSPGIVHGLLQTEGYAGAMIATLPGVTAEVLATRIASRMARQQRVLYRDDPPLVCAIVDHVSLYRRVGSPEVMAGQMAHLLEIAALPNVVLLVMPAVEHPATASELIIADNSAAYCEHLAAGGVYTEAAAVTGLERLFATLQGETYRASESTAVIRKAHSIWTGEKAATAAPTDHASKPPQRTARSSSATPPTATTEP